MEKKTRSPRYPSINLQEAIEKVRIIYDKEHIHKALREVVAKDLGYTGINGTSATVISSIKQYGLIEQIGEYLKVTEDATTILELPHNDPERIEAIKRAALTPKLFSEIYEEFGDKLPSDESLRLLLVRQGFNSKAANSVIRAYRETLSIVKSETQSYNEESNTFDASPNMHRAISIMPIEQQQQLNATKIANSLEAISSSFGNITENLQYRISDDCKARVLFEGTVTREAIKKLIAYLELGLDDFPSKAKLAEQDFDEQRESKLLPEHA